MFCNERAEDFENNVDEIYENQKEHEAIEGVAHKELRFRTISVSEDDQMI
jgi:hypothetical protein